MALEVVPGSVQLLVALVSSGDASEIVASLNNEEIGRTTVGSLSPSVWSLPVSKAGQLVLQLTDKSPSQVVIADPILKGAKQ